LGAPDQGARLRAQLFLHVPILHEKGNHLDSICINKFMWNVCILPI
jgi:hypothetical protein